MKTPDRIGSRRDREHHREKAVWLCELLESGVMMAVGHLNHIPWQAARAPGRPEFA
jgi:hypothetical protein